MIKSLYKDSCIFVNKNFAGLFKGVNIEWDKELEDSLEFIDLGLTPREVIVFAWFTALLFFVLSFLAAMVALFIGMNALYILLFGMILACLSLYLIPMYPVRLVVFEKMRALGYAPRLIAYLIIPLKQDPNLEKAVKFASEHGDDKLADDLKQLLWHTWSGKHNSIGEALPILGHKWGEHIKGLRDSLYAIRTSQMEKHEHRRLDTLDRALRELLDNIQIKFKEFTNELRVPTTVLFMGGVLIPLVAVMFLPVLSMMGFQLGTPLGLSVLLFVIVLAVFMVSEFILTKRPVAFSPIRIPKDYPGLITPGKIRIGNREVSLIKFSLGIVGLISLASVPYLLSYPNEMAEKLNTLPIVIGVFVGLWIYFRYDSLPRLKVRNDIERAEEECIEASFHIGNRLVSGMPAEESLIKVSKLLSNPEKDSQLSRILENTVRNIRYMNLNLRDAFFHPEKGSLKDAHSGLIHGIFKMFVNSMERGVDSAAETLINSANHFREIRKVENALREKISYTTSMMKVSATMIAPALCALAIPLTEIFIKILGNINANSEGNEYVAELGVEILKTPSLTPDLLTLILGAYMLSLLIILIRFTAILEYGNDEVKIKTEISNALPKALIIFTAVLFLGRIFFAQMV